MIANEVTHQCTTEVTCRVSGPKEMESHTYNQKTSPHQPSGMLPPYSLLPSVCFLLMFMSPSIVSRLVAWKGLVDLIRVCGQEPSAVDSAPSALGKWVWPLSPRD